MHKQKILSNANFKLPITEKISKEIVSLPIYYGLDMTSQNKIIKAINSFTF